MLFKNITILNENSEIKENMYVGTEGKKIAYVGDHAPEKNYGEEYDGKGKLLMPAFYNAHAHSPMTLMRGYGENLSLQDWLNTRIFPFEDHLDSEAVYNATLLAMAESLRYGIVSSSDMYYFCADMARAVEESGAKANISRAISQFEEGSIKDTPRFKEAEEFVKEWHGAADGRILVDASIHAEYTNTLTSMAEVSEYAAKNNIIMHVHISETKQEHEECKNKYDGKTPAQLLNEIGAFETPAVAAHCIWTEDSDVEIFKEKGVTIATCPVSNLKLASGICDVRKYLENGINVAIGTDSVASNNSLNFIEEMKYFALLGKAKTGDPTVITPEQTIYAATRAGAIAQGRKDAGILAEGMTADLIVIDIDQPHMRPVHDLKNNLVYSASGSDVVLTMCDGKVLYKDGIFLTIDVEKAIEQTEKSCARILAKL